MNLHLHQKTFLVGGASSGLGRGVAEALLREGARVIAISRSRAPLEALAEQYGEHLEPYPADLTDEHAVQKLLDDYADTEISGVLVNAGGPPSMPVLDTRLSDWDAAYHSVLRWKVQLIQGLLPAMMERGFGRFVLIESMTVKQPSNNMVLSNALRLAVVGYVKTLSREIAGSGITLNILAPGYHATPRVDQLVQKNSERRGVPEEEIRAGYLREIPVGFMGDPADFGSLAAWLFSPYSRYLTGQTISVDGGVIGHSFG